MAHGYKTKTKELIYACFLKNQNTLISAKELYLTLSDMGYNINITTIYRNLEAMSKAGDLMRFSEEEGGVKYKYTGELGACREHLHLKCVKCGKLHHLDCHFMKELSEHSKAEHGFSLLCEQSMLYGIYKNCNETV